MLKLDIFDFDDTLYNGDSTIDFYVFNLKQNFGLIRYLPIQVSYYIMYKLRIVKKTKFKEEFFSFLKGIKNVDEKVKLFWEENSNKIRINMLKNCKNKIVVISASPDFLLENICKKIKIEKLIASNVDKKTGKFNSENCYGEEKVKRLNMEIDNYIIENFYSDSLSDKPLAKLSKKNYLIKKGEIKEWII